MGFASKTGTASPRQIGYIKRLLAEKRAAASTVLGDRSRLEDLSGFEASRAIRHLKELPSPTPGCERCERLGLPQRSPCMHDTGTAYGHAYERRF